MNDDIECPYCNSENYVYHDGGEGYRDINGVILSDTSVSWETIKKIYATAVKHFNSGRL